MLALLLLGSQVAAPETPFPADWIQKNAHVVKSIDPAHEDFADLAAVGEKIGDARVVLLGEQTHGDGATFLAKCRLIKYLHQKKGFTVLAWESGMYDCREADRAVLAGEEPREAMSRGVFGIWTASKEVQPVLQYVASQRKGSNPIETAGFDCQISAPYAAQNYLPDLKKAIVSVDPKLIAEEDEAKIFSLKDTLKDLPALSDEELAERGRLFESLISRVMEKRAAFDAKLGAREAEFMLRCMHNFRTFLDLSRLYKDRSKMVEGSTLRDKAMGENMNYLAGNYYKDKKIIVWAASFHTARKMSALEHPMQEMKTFKPMSEVFHALMPQGTYSITFVGYDGEAGNAWTKPYQVPPAPVGSFEEVASRLNLPFLFFDLRTAPSKFMMRPLGNGDMTGDWKANFDGVIFTRKLTPSTRVQ